MIDECIDLSNNFICIVARLGGLSWQRGIPLSHVELLRHKGRGHFPLRLNNINDKIEGWKKKVLLVFPKLGMETAGVTWHVFFQHWDMLQQVVVSDFLLYCNCSLAARVFVVLYGELHL